MNLNVQNPRDDIDSVRQLGWKGQTIDRPNRPDRPNRTDKQAEQTAHSSGAPDTSPSVSTTVQLRSIDCHMPDPSLRLCLFEIMSLLNPFDKYHATRLLIRRVLADAHCAKLVSAESVPEVEAFAKRLFYLRAAHPLVPVHTLFVWSTAVLPS